MIQKIIMAVIILLGGIKSNAQSRMAEYHSLLPDYKTAGSEVFNGASKRSINYPTGTLNINFPIHTIKLTPDYSLPISLSYNTGGIKVGQRDDGFGLGWNLNGVFSITREVRGLPDEYGNLIYDSNLNSHIGGVPESHQFPDDWLRVGIATAYLRKETGGGSNYRNNSFIDLNNSTVTNLSKEPEFG